eukprot:gene1762-8433_t
MNPPGENRCAFIVVLVALASMWHVLSAELREHGPVSAALGAVMACMFRGDLQQPVGSLPGEHTVVRRFIALYFAMKPWHVQGEQQAMCEVWEWVVGALREEHYEWRNVAFYRGFTPMQPSGVSVDALLKPAARGGKAGDYVWLESHHGWVQWAFPTCEQGQNPHSCPLSPAELQAFRTDAELRRRGVRACKVFLEFLGLQFTEAGRGARQDDEEGRSVGGIRVARVMGGGWQPRAANWEGNPHNNLRVTRMLQFLVLTGALEWAKAFVHFIQQEVRTGEFLWCRNA